MIIETKENPKTLSEIKVKESLIEIDFENLYDILLS